MKQIRLQQGDSFTMNFVIKSDGTAAYLNSGETMAVGLYNEFGKKYIVTTKNGITKSSNIGQYVIQIPGTATKEFIGNVNVEIVIYDSSGTKVSHADKVVKMFFEPREINNDI